MRSLPLLALLVLQSWVLWADAGEPLGLSVAGTWKGRIVESHRDTAARLIIYPRTAWDAASPTFAVFDVNSSRYVDKASALNVLDAAFFNGGILMAHRQGSNVHLRMVTRDAGATVVDDVMLAEVPVGADSLTVRLLVNHDETSALVLAGQMLYAVKGSQSSSASGYSIRLLEQRVFAAVPVRSASGSGAVFAFRSGPSAFLALTDSTLRIIWSMLIPLSDVERIEQVGSSVLLVSSLEGAGGSVVTVLDLATRNATTRSLPVEASRVTALEIDGVLSLAFVTTRSGRAEVVCVPLSMSFEGLPAGVIIPGDYGSPRLVRSFGDTVVIVFSAGLSMVTGGGDILAREAIQIPLGGEADITRSGSGLLVSSSTQSTLVRQRAQRLWFVARSWEWLLRYVIPLLFITTLGVLYLVYRRQRRFLEAMIDAPGAGVVLFVDVNGRLLRANERGSALLRITSDVPMGRMYTTYMNRADLANLAGFIERVRHSRESHSEKISLSVDDELRELIVTSTPIVGTLGSARGMLFTGVDITETLEQRRLVNWAQLAHDMQTNLSTIRLNAEQIHGNTEGGDDERRRRILFQVGVLIDRVRDLLGVARSDVFQRSMVHSAELCTEVRHEFDSTMFPHVTFSMKLRGTLMMADRLKLSRAVRNAVENAIKALRNQPGTVEISTWFDRTNVFISVSDTGVGMDPETMANMMKPYFSSSADGTGHGIGTMIMHHVTKLHGGRIRVTSERGKGTQVVFRIPHGMEPKDKIRASTAERAA
ncbi:MAG: HAMP domain-containing histidine kinase [Candidatus Kapabacteria bacterium]|nr:HAMP domain-containing histidine kinase [Candidatus Kapabacteria bacterium]